MSTYIAKLLSYPSIEPPHTIAHQNESLTQQRHRPSPANTHHYHPTILSLHASLAWFSGGGCGDGVVWQGCVAMVGAKVGLASHTRAGDSHCTAPMAELLESLSKCLSQLSTFLLYYPKPGSPRLYLCFWDLLILTP